MKVLIATDGSEESARIITPAGQFAAAIGAEVVLVRVLSDSDADRAAVEAELALLLTERGITGRTSAISGDSNDIVATISDSAADEGAGFVAVGSRGRSRLREALLGSVTTGVLGRAAGPVMVGGSHLEQRVAGAPYHILATTDGSAAGDAAVADIAALGAPEGSLQITLFRAYSPVSAPELDAADRKKIAAELQTLGASLPPGTGAVEHVQPVGPGQNLASAIVAAAAERGADAIWMGTHGHSMRARVLAGSTALGVLERSPLPVVLVRE